MSEMTERYMLVEKLIQKYPYPREWYKNIKMNQLIAMLYRQSKANV